MSKPRAVFIIILAVLFSVVSSVVSLGLSSQKILSPLEHYGTFKGIDSDRWIVDGAKISLPGLFGRGNQLKLHFKDWHPLEYSDLEFSVCGKSQSRIAARPGGTATVFLHGACQPRTVDIKVHNPLGGGQTDARLLGIQLDHAEVTSKFSWPLPSLKRILKFSLFIFPLFLIVGLLCAGAFPPLAMAFVSAATIYLSQYHFLDNFNPLFSLYVFSLLLAAGMLCAKKYTIKLPTKLPTDPTSYFYPMLFLAALGGLLLRCYNIDFGLPFNYHPDEVPKYNAIERMRHHGDLNPRYFLHPTLLLYSTYFYNFLFRSLIDASQPWGETLILAGRYMSTTAGVLSIVLTGLIGRRIFSPMVGGIAALSLAAYPLHVACSRYVKEDSLLVFCVLLAVYLTVLAVQSKKPAILLLAGLAAGLSAGTKYSGLMSVMILVAAPFLVTGTLIPDKRYLSWTIRGILMIPVGFLIVTPYALFDLGTFIKDFSHESWHMSHGHSSSITSWSQLWMYHFERSLSKGMQIIPLATGMLGLGFCLYKGMFRKKQIIALYIPALVLLYYFPAEYVNAKPAPQPERYVMPCLPFLAIAAGYFLMLIRQRCGQLVFMIWAVAMLAQPAMRSWQLASELRPETRDLMSDWVNQNIPKGSEVLIDWRPYAAQFEHDDYQLSFLPRGELLEAMDPSELKQSGADYLMMSSLYYDRHFSQPNVTVIHREKVRKVFRNFKEVKRFAPKYGTYGFHNPTLHLFKIKNENAVRNLDPLS